MPVNVIGTLKPKNNGKFPVAEAVDIKVTDDLRLDEALEKKADLSSVNFALAGKADNSDINSLQSQINEIITPVTQDAEVQTARVGADGTSYVTLKARLDSENHVVTDLNNSFITERLYELETGSINSAGAVVALEDFRYNTPIFLNKYDTISLKGGAVIYRIAIYYAKDTVVVGSTMPIEYINETSTSYTADKDCYVCLCIDTRVSPNPEIIVNGNARIKKLWEEIRAIRSSDNFIAPEMFGAIGDGVSDDSTALDDTFAYARLKYIPVKLSGEYVVTKQLNATNCIIIGDGVGKLKTLSANTRFEGAILKSENNLYLDGVKFDCSCSEPFEQSDKFVRYNNAINFTGVNLSVTNCEFKNLYNIFINITGNSVYSVVIKDNHFMANNKTNIFMANHLSIYNIINSNATILIEDNQFEGYEYEYVDEIDNDMNCNSAALLSSFVRVKEFLINKNYFSHLGKYGSTAASAGYSRVCVLDMYFNCYPVTISNNIISNCHWSAIRYHCCSDGKIINNVISMARACLEGIIIVSSGYASAGDDPTGNDDIKIIGNTISSHTPNGFTEYAIMSSGYSASDENVMGFWGTTDRLTISNNQFIGFIKRIFLFDPSTKAIEFSNNIVNIRRIGGTTAPCIATTDLVGIPIKTAANNDFSNTIIYVTNNRINHIGINIMLYSDDLAINSLLKSIKCFVLNSVLSTPVSYCVRGARADETSDNNISLVGCTLTGEGAAVDVRRAYNNIGFTTNGFIRISDGSGNENHII